MHLIIPILQAVLYWTIGFRDLSFKSALWDKPFFRNFSTVESFLFPISLLIYSVLSLYLLKRSSTQEYFWDKDLKNWLSSFAKIFIFITALEFGVTLLDFFSSHLFSELFFIVRVLIFTSIIFWVAYNAFMLLNPFSIYKTLPLNTPATIAQAIKTPVIKTQFIKATQTQTELALATDERQQIKTALIKLMEQDKIYLNSDLTTKILAEYIGTSEKKCASILRTEWKSNFNKFINTYRIKAFKELLAQGRHKELTLLSMAFECGFESKSTFNRSFKQETGLTPSQYIKSL